jgi:hypothetical protein
MDVELPKSPMCVYCQKVDMFQYTEEELKKRYNQNSKKHNFSINNEEKILSFEKNEKIMLMKTDYDINILAKMIQILLWEMLIVSTSCTGMENGYWEIMQVHLVKQLVTQ